MASATEQTPQVAQNSSSPPKGSPTKGVSPQRIRTASYESMSAASRIASTNTSSEDAGSQSDLGTLLRLKELTIHDLPQPPGWSKDNDKIGPPANSSYWLGSKENDHPSVVEFIEAILLEGHRFIKTRQKFHNIGTTDSKPAIAKVQKIHRSVHESELKALDWNESICSTRRGYKPRKEDWFGRESIHTTEMKDGTASWMEFVDGLLYDHNDHEAEYDPSVYDHRCIIDWKPSIDAATSRNEFAHRFSDLSMKVMEMCHTIPVGTPRHFTMVMVSGRVHPCVFLTVQVPVNIRRDVPEAFYSNGRNVKEGSTVQQRKKTIEGQYSAIEQCVHDATKGQVTWTMATASDAKGYIPLPIQKLALPGQVAKDVGFFMDWVRQKYPRPSASRQASRVSTSSRRQGGSPRGRAGSVGGSINGVNGISGTLGRSGSLDANGTLDRTGSLGQNGGIDRVGSVGSARRIRIA